MRQHIPSPEQLIRGEGGFALASVMFLGAVMVLLTAIIVVRSGAQSQIQVNDGQWEQSLHVAEGSMDVYISDLISEPDVNAITTGHLSSQLQTKADIISEAEDYAALFPSEIIDTPEGEAVILKPVDDTVIYAVGFTPDYTTPGRKARVIEIDYDFGVTPGLWSPLVALLVGDDLKMPGQVVFKWDAGGLHTNGELDLDGKVWADYCVTASGGLDGNSNNIKKLGPGCEPKEDVGDEPLMEVPAMAARDLWDDAEYQMCPDGQVRAGPGHPDPVSAATAGATPCLPTAFVLGNANGQAWKGWKMTGVDAKLGSKWDYTSNQPNNGSFYFYHGSVTIGTGPANWAVSVVTEASGTTGNKVGGDIVISGNIGSVPYNSDDVNMFADRDLEVSGNKNAEGIMVAKEQLKMSGNPSIDGSLVIAGEQDTPDSTIHESEISGSPTIRYNGGGTTEWVTGSSGPSVFTIVDRTEV